MLSCQEKKIVQHPTGKPGTQKYDIQGEPVHVCVCVGGGGGGNYPHLGIESQRKSKEPTLPKLTDINPRLKVHQGFHLGPG